MQNQLLHRNGMGQGAVKDLQASRERKKDGGWERGRGWGGREQERELTQI